MRKLLVIWALRSPGCGVLALVSGGSLAQTKDTNITQYRNTTRRRCGPPIGSPNVDDGGTGYRIGRRMEADHLSVCAPRGQIRQDSRVHLPAPGADGSEHCRELRLDAEQQDRRFIICAKG